MISSIGNDSRRINSPPYRITSSRIESIRSRKTRSTRTVSRKLTRAGTTSPRRHAFLSPILGDRFTRHFCFDHALFFRRSQRRILGVVSTRCSKYQAGDEEQHFCPHDVTIARMELNRKGRVCSKAHRRTPQSFFLRHQPVAKMKESRLYMPTPVRWVEFPAMMSVRVLSRPRKPVLKWIPDQ